MPNFWQQKKNLCKKARPTLKKLVLVSGTRILSLKTAHSLSAVAMMMVAVAEFVVACQEKSKEKDKKPVYGKKVEETKKKKQLLADLQVVTVPR